MPRTEKRIRLLVLNAFTSRNCSAVKDLRQSQLINTVASINDFLFSFDILNEHLREKSKQNSKTNKIRNTEDTAHNDKSKHDAIMKPNKNNIKYIEKVLFT